MNTKGNKYKLAQRHCRYDLTWYNFTNRVIPIWNSFVYSYSYCKNRWHF